MKWSFHTLPFMFLRYAFIDSCCSPWFCLELLLGKVPPFYHNFFASRIFQVIPLYFPIVSVVILKSKICWTCDARSCNADFMFLLHLFHFRHRFVSIHLFPILYCSSAYICKLMSSFVLWEALLTFITFFCSVTVSSFLLPHRSPPSYLFLLVISIT